MKDVIIVSGGNIQRDFALDFLRNRIERTGQGKALPDCCRQRVGIFYGKSSFAGCGCR